MEPSEREELTDRELDGILAQWKTPSAPARLKAAVFGDRRAPWWRRIWSASIRVPVPLALALVALAAMIVVMVPRAPRVIVRTERVEVPVYLNPPAVADAAWHPVRELRPRIIRGSDAQ